MDKQLSPQVVMWLFIVAGVMFILAGAFSQQPAFYGLGAAFIAISVIFSAKKK